MMPPWTSGSGGGSSGCGVELVGDEPAIGADVEVLQSGAPVSVDAAERREDRRVRERSGGPRRSLGATGGLQPEPDPVGPRLIGAGERQQPVGVGLRPLRGDRPRKLGLRGRVADPVDDLGQVAAADVVLLDPLEQAFDLVKQRRGRFGGAVLVAVAVGEEEPAPGERQAGVEEVALLRLGVASRLQAESSRCASERKGSESPAAARELAVLQGGDEDVVEARGPQPVGVGDPDPVLDRPAPDPDRDTGQRLRDRIGQWRQAVERGALGHRRGDGAAGPRLQLGVRPSAHRRGERSDLGRQVRRSARRLADPGDPRGGLLISLLPECERGGCRLDAVAAEPALEPIDSRWPRPRRSAQVAQEVRRAAAPQHGLQQGVNDPPTEVVRIGTSASSAGGIP